MIAKLGRDAGIDGSVLGHADATVTVGVCGHALRQDVRTAAARAVRRWVAVYTAGVAGEIAERRRLELESDIWKRLHGPAPTRSPGGILGRCLRGVPADVWWR